MAQMTLQDLNGTVRECVRFLQLGPGSWRCFSTYHDYVTLEFALFADDRKRAWIEAQFKALCRKFGWECCRVTLRNDRSILVTIHERNMISTDGNRRMPSGLPPVERTGHDKSCGCPACVAEADAILARR